MTSIGRWPSPYSGLCLPCGWKKAPIPRCVDWLTIFTSESAISVAVDFTGRGKVGPSGFCAGSDAYVTVGAGNSSTIDVWRAHLDGVWTSSVDILVYVQTAVAAGTIYAQPIYNAAMQQTKASAFYNLTCAAAPSVATVTIYDDGTISIS